MMRDRHPNPMAYGAGCNCPRVQASQRRHERRAPCDPSKRSGGRTYAPRGRDEASLGPMTDAGSFASISHDCARMGTWLRSE
jgi:hypothetical protein